MKGGVNMWVVQEVAECPECGKEVDAKGYTLECEHCLTKQEE